MDGKVVVITGATSGIGAVAAETLASMGARIVAIARDRKRGEALMARLRQKGPAQDHGVRYADLSVLADMKRVANDIAAAEPRIDVLINNAGAVYDIRQITVDGLERTFATNHLSYYVVTQLLRDKLLASAPARVINTSSEAHRGVNLDFDDLQMAMRYRGFRAYRRSKLCNILFTRELARQLAGLGVTANCLHPGFVKTRFGDEGRSIFSRFFRLAKTLAITPERGARTIIYLASSKEGGFATGQYFDKCKPKTPSAQARDDSAASRLWKESAKLSGV